MCVRVCVCVWDDILLIQSLIIGALGVLYVESCMKVKICIGEDN